MASMGAIVIMLQRLQGANLTIFMIGSSVVIVGLLVLLVMTIKLYRSI